MNKKGNTIVFILVATVVNVLIMFAIFALFLLLYFRFLAPVLSPDVNQIMLIVIFFLTVGLTYLSYNGLMKLFAKKVDMEKHFDPLIKPRNRKQ